MKFKKLRIFCLTALLCLTACGAPSAQITVVSREEGSGTRSSFAALTGVERDGIDRTTRRAEINSSTAVVLQTVEGDRNAIAYLSVSALRDGVKALRIDGAAPSAANVKNGSYPISRPFYAATKGEPRPAARDFLNFVQSGAGQAVVAGSGYVPTESSGTFRSVLPKGTVTVEGSTSVAPVMEKLAEAYMAENPAVRVQIQTTDSSTGMLSVQNGLCDIAMSSRALRDEERNLNAIVVCMDAIAVIVHPDNPLDGLTRKQLCDIYTGAVTDWSSLGAA